MVFLLTIIGLIFCSNNSNAHFFTETTLVGSAISVQSKSIMKIQKCQALIKHLEYTYYSQKLTREMFEQIWDHFNGDIHKLAVFFTHTIYNTAAFKILKGEQNPEYGIYFSRGILQVLSKENYQIIGEPFLSNPNLLSSLSPLAIKASLNFYSHIIDSFCQLTLTDSLYFLNPVEIQKENYKQECFGRQINRRLHTYIELCIVFDIKPNYGSKTIFLQKNEDQINEIENIISSLFRHK